MAINIKKLVSAKAIHPGEVLIDELNARNINQKTFSLLTGIPQTQLNEIIKGKRDINADVSLLIAKVLNMDAILWMNLQANYDLDLLKIKEKTQKQLEALDKWDMIKDYIPSTFFKKTNTISGDPLNDIPTIYNIYSVKNSDELISVYSSNNYSRFRKSEKLAVDKINLIGWVKLVAFKAQQINVKPFNHINKDELLIELKKIFKINKQTVEKTTTLLAKYGIKLIIQVHPEKCAVDGVAFWSTGNPAIGISLRHKRIDNFAFTILHELGHIYLHLINNNNAEFIDLDNDQEYSQSLEELEANDFSKDALINADMWAEFLLKNRDKIHSMNTVKSFASLVGVHPAIIYGRFSKETGNYKIKSTLDKALY